MLSLLFHDISYIGINSQFALLAFPLNKAVWKKPVKLTIKFYFLCRLCFIIWLFTHIVCELIFHLNASYNYKKYWTITSLVLKYQHSWPSHMRFRDDGESDMLTQWRKRWGGERGRMEVGDEKWEDGTEVSSPEEEGGAVVQESRGVWRISRGNQL